MNIKRVNKRSRHKALELFAGYKCLTLVLLYTYDAKGEEIVIASLEHEDEAIMMKGNIWPVVWGRCDDEAMDRLVTVINGATLILDEITVPEWVFDAS